MSDAAPAMNTNSIKNPYNVCISYPKKYVVFPDSGYSALNTPASLLAAAFARNHTAISKDANFNGANLFTSARPIGDKHNSPQVWSAYIPVSQIMLTFIPGPTSFTPKAIHRYPSARRNKPIAILVGEEGSFFPSFNHNHAKKGANETTNIELRDWNQLAGTSSNIRLDCACVS